VVVSALLLPGCSADDSPSRPDATGTPPGPSGVEGPVLGATHELLPDPGGDGVLLLTGPPELEPAGDPLTLWRWDGTRWAEVPAPGDVPPQRAYFGTAYDAERGVVVLYGGDLAEEQSATVWEWDGETWSQHDVAGPGPRLSSAMTYDDAGLVVLYGGDDQGEIHNDTWGWDGRRWEQLANAGPRPPRWPGAFVDVAGGGPLLVGGHQVVDDDLPPALGDTWTWDDGWEEVADAGTPPRLVNAKAVVHPEHGTLLVGGADLQAASGDVLRWNGSAWEKFAEDVFPERQAFGLAYDASRDVMVLTGGVVEPGQTDRHQDVWEWSGDPAEPAVQVLAAPPA
jgi:hypothetical protein